jgi:hypothetical protein
LLFFVLGSTAQSLPDGSAARLLAYFRHLERKLLAGRQPGGVVFMPSCE